MDSTLAFSLALLAIAAGLVISQRLAWAQLIASQRRDREFATRQIARRMQMGTLVGVLAISIFAGDWITSVAWSLAFWSAIALLVLWVVLLAVADLRATRRHYGQLLRDNQAAQIRFQTEALRRTEKQRNVSHPVNDPASRHSLN